MQVVKNRDNQKIKIYFCYKSQSYFHFQMFKTNPYFSCKYVYIV